MEIDIARHVVRAVFRSGRELQELLGLLKDHCGAEEYTVYAKAIASAMASIHLEVLNRVTSAHPALEDEIEADIREYGRYL